MRNISVEALHLLLEDVQRVAADWERARQSLIEYEIVDEEDLLLSCWPSNIEAKIWRRIDAKQKQLDERRREESEARGE